MKKGGGTERKKMGRKRWGTKCRNINATATKQKVKLKKQRHNDTMLPCQQHATRQTAGPGRRQTEHSSAHLSTPQTFILDMDTQYGQKSADAGFHSPRRRLSVCLSSGACLPAGPASTAPGWSRSCAVKCLHGVTCQVSVTPRFVVDHV